jgi:hypothetical protein
MQIPTAQTVTDALPLAYQIHNKLPVQGNLRLIDKHFVSHTTTLVNILTAALLLASLKDTQRKVIDASVLIDVLDNDFPVEIKKFRHPVRNLKPDTIIAYALILKSRLEAFLASEGQALTFWKVADWANIADETTGEPTPTYTISTSTQTICVNAILDDALASIKHHLEELP